jgi:hypothetical protein
MSGCGVPVAEIETTICEHGTQLARYHEQAAALGVALVTFEKTEGQRPCACYIAEHDREWAQQILVSDASNAQLQVFEAQRSDIHGLSPPDEIRGLSNGARNFHPVGLAV